MDPRYIALARNLVSHSTNLQTGEKVLVHAFDIPEKMTLAYKGYSRKGRSFVQVQSALLDRVHTWCNEEQFDSALTGKWSVTEDGCLYCLTWFK